LSGPDGFQLTGRGSDAADGLLCPDTVIIAPTVCCIFSMVSTSKKQYPGKVAFFLSAYVPPFLFSIKFDRTFSDELITRENGCLEKHSHGR
jgi:hypothetical protein